MSSEANRAISGSSLGALVGVGSDPLSRQGSVSQFLPPSSIPYGSSPYFLSRKKGDSYSKWHPFGNSPSNIMTKLKVGHALSMIYKLEGSRSILHPYSNPAEQFVTSEDLNVIRDSSSSIIMSPPALYKTSRDYCSGHLCLNEYMLRAKVWVPFKFGVAVALVAFHISPAHVSPHSWKVI
ncbi:hypothetical protein ACLOJK_006647 [Asimina triloba]